MILACHHIQKAFLDQTVLKDATFHIEEHEKVALVGSNGAGKTTLLRIILGEMVPDDGLVTLSKGSTIGYLAQHQELAEQASIKEVLLQVKAHLFALEQDMRTLEKGMKTLSGDALEEAYQKYHRLTTTFEQENGYAFESEVTGILKGLGFLPEEFDKPLSTLSGGQKTRVALGRLLLTQPDILLLDEPTNHLDMDSIRWLETYLSNYKGAVLLVSHDRYFMDRIVSKVLDLDQGILTVYPGNYSSYSILKKERMDALIHQYMNQQKEIRRQEEVIEKLRSFNREKSIKRAESREKLLEKTERLEKPTGETEGMRFQLNPPVTSGNDVLHAAHLKKAFGNQLLFSDLSLEIRRGERVALIGANGTGKTTLLKIIQGLLSPDGGEVRLGARVETAYYDQEHQVLHPEKTLFEELSDAYPHMTNTEIRNVLAAFLFTGEDVYKTIASLSGGERGRVSLAKLMLSNANFLIFDEPTNHLDILSKEILEQALCRYTGTLLFVSHDRYFINQTATRILDLTHGQLISYIGNYDYYLEKKDLLTAQLLPENEDADKEAVPSASATDWAAQKEAQSRERKRQRDMARCEKEIEALETRDGEIDLLLTQEDIYTDVARLLPLQKEKEAIAHQLEQLYEQWTSLSEES